MKPLEVCMKPQSQSLTNLRLCYGETSVQMLFMLGDGTGTCRGWLFLVANNHVALQRPHVEKY